MNETNFTESVELIDLYFSAMSNFTNLTLDSLRNDTDNLISAEKLKLEHGDKILGEIVYALLTVSRGLQGWWNAGGLVGGFVVRGGR